MMKSIFRAAITLCVVAPLAVGQIYSNGPLITHPGAGAGGADASALDNTPAPAGPALNVLGFNVNGAAGVRTADEFAVPCGQTWTLTGIDLFAYQTGSTTTSTFTGGNFRIWSAGGPAGGGTILHDFSATNQMTATSWPNIYRTTVTTLTATTRPVMRTTLNGNGIVLGQGTYWLDWALTGSLASGPFGPSISYSPGQNVTGNAVQYLAAAPWVPAVDNGPLGSFQGMPFELHGSIALNNCFALNITQPGGPSGNVILANTGGTPGNTALNVITLYGGNFPSGWFFGVDVPINELGTIANSSAPFVVTLDALGGYSLTITGVFLPSPVPVYYVGLELNGASLVVADAAKTVTLS
jgi:hypothetical protein